jgi:hypothetical protein
MGKSTTKPIVLLLLRSLIITISIIIPYILVKNEGLWGKVRTWIESNTVGLLVFFIPSFIVLSVWLAKYILRNNERSN